MRKPWREHVFTKILCLSLLSALLPMLLVDLIWFTNTRDTLTENARASSAQILEQISASMQQGVYNINTIALSVILDAEFNDILQSASVVDGPSESGSAALLSMLNTAKSLNDSIAAITVLSKDMVYAVSTARERLNYEKLFEQEWYIEFVRTGITRAYTSIHTCPYINRVNTSTYSILLRVQPNNNHLKPAFLIIEIYASPYIQLLSGVKSDDVVVAILNSRGEECYSTNDNASLGDDPIVIKKGVDTLNWTLQMSIRRKSLTNSIDDILRLSTMALIAVLIIMIGFSTIFSLHITRPVRALSRATRQVRDGNLSIQVPITTQDEIGHMSEDFNTMIQRISVLMEEIRISEHEKYNAEIKALQAQINPHFLYNTLNVIRWLSMMKENDKIEHLIISLVQLLEYTKEDVDAFVPISREIEHVRRYVDVMSIRYDGRFVYKECIENNVESYYTIRFILQPLVENAIFHGIDPSGKVGTVSLSIMIEEDRILMAVSDDGVGLDLESSRHRFFSGYGISNVNDRLRMQLGEESMLKVESELGKGTTVHFSIPLLPNNPDGDGEESP